MTVAPTHYEWIDDKDGIRYEIWPAKTIQEGCPPDATCYEVRNPETATNTHVCDQEWGTTGPTQQDFRRILDKARKAWE